RSAPAWLTPPWLQAATIRDWRARDEWRYREGPAWSLDRGGTRRRSLAAWRGPALPAPRRAPLSARASTGLRALLDRARGAQNARRRGNDRHQLPKRNASSDRVLRDRRRAGAPRRRPHRPTSRTRDLRQRRDQTLSAPPPATACL